MRASRWVLVASLGALGACQAPITNATPATAKVTVRKIVSASVHVTLRATLDVLTQQGLVLRIADEDAGRVETDYLDLTTVAPDAENYPAPERAVRFIFRIQPDTLGRGSILLVSTVYRPYGGGGEEDNRRRERLVPSDHPGAAYTRKILAKIEEAALGLERTN